jgi:carbonic anhydrase
MTRPIAGSQYPNRRYHHRQMKKLFHFDAPREKYHCDAAIVWCFDNRFELGFRKYLKKSGILNTDPIKIAGGAKSLASPERESDRTFIIDQIRKSMALHGTRRAILMLHSDCGAYGGLAAFRNDETAEMAHHREELRRAASNLKSAIPGIDVDCYYVNFEGVWQPEADD